MRKMIVREMAGMIDHTLLKPFVSKEDFAKHCQESVDYGFKMVAINSCETARCKKYLEGTDVHVGAAIAFPLGQMSIEAKAYETADALSKGADEIDYVINIVELKNKNYDFIKKEMKSIVNLCRKYKAISKVIFENCYLTKEEIVKVAEIAREVKPDFIKTSTGLGPSGAKVEDVRLMKSIVGDEVKVKASGGVRDLETFMAMVDAGAERIGTSSSVSIIEDYKKMLEKEAEEASAAGEAAAKAAEEAENA